jgi:hypothetical protein
MPIEKTWIIVDLHTARALTHAEEPRHSMHFTSPEAASRSLLWVLASERAKAERNAASFDMGRYLVVELAA